MSDCALLNLLNELGQIRCEAFLSISFSYKFNKCSNNTGAQMQNPICII